MSTTAVPSTAASTQAALGKVDLKLEVVTIPVSDVERAKAFYVGLGWRLDADFTAGGDHRGQGTPPRSPPPGALRPHPPPVPPGWVHSAPTAPPAVPGSTQQLWLIVSDIQAARAELLARGVDVSEVF